MNEDNQVISACLKAAVDGPFFPGWEFSTIFGLTRDEVRMIADAWPNVESDNAVANRAVKSTLNNLLGYPHGKENGWKIWIPVPRDDVRMVFTRWKVAHSQESNIEIEQWEPTHPRWGELAAMMVATNQRRYLDVHFDWHLAHFWFIALVNGEIAGLLHYALQYIGDDDDCQRVTLNGEELTEGKVMGFVVVEKLRRRGIGRSLQQAAIDHARSQNCFQFRSYSDGDKIANHQLKLSMGFTVHPTIRKDDNAGAYFIMPLKQHDDG